MITAVLSFALDFWLPGDPGASVESSQDSGPDYSVLFDAIESKLGHWGLILSLAGSALFILCAIIFGYLLPVFRFVFDVLFLAARWVTAKLGANPVDGETPTNACQIGEAKKALSGILILVAGVLPAVAVLLRPPRESGAVAAPRPRSGEPELELLFGFTKNDLIAMSEVLVLGTVVIALASMIVLPIVRHVMRAIPPPGYTRREIRRVGYWIVAVWLAMMMIIQPWGLDFLPQFLLVAAVLWLVRPVLEWLRLWSNQVGRPYAIGRVILFCVSIVLVAVASRQMGLPELDFESLSGRNAGKIAELTNLNQLFEVLFAKESLIGLVPLIFIVGVANPMARLAVDIVSHEAARKLGAHTYEDGELSPGWTGDRTLKKRMAIGAIIFFAAIAPTLYLSVDDRGFASVKLTATQVEPESSGSQTVQGEPGENPDAWKGEQGFWGMTKGEVIEYGEVVTVIVSIFVFALAVLLPLSRHILVSIPGVDFTRREVRLALAGVSGIWLVITTAAFVPAVF